MDSNFDILQGLSALDFTIFFVILGITLLVVILGARLKDSSSIVQYILMGRRLTLPFFVGTLVATWYGGIFGVTQIAFESGIYNFLIQGVFWYAAYLIFAWFIVNKITQKNFVTLPDLVRKNVGPKSGFIAGIFNIANVLPISYVISIGLLINMIFDIPFVLSMILGTSFVLLYSFTSGFRAIVLSDMVQFTVMVSSVLLVLIFSEFKFGGWDFLTAQLPAGHFNILGTASLSTTLVWGFIALSTLVDPNFYQRCFAAESPKTARRGIYIAIVVWVLFDICTTAGGLYARALLPEAKANQAYLLYALQLLPEGLKGFFLAGIVATILSTIDSYIFIASNTIAYDLFPKVSKNPIVWHRISMFLVGGVAIFLGSAFDGNIKAVWKTLGSYSAACLLFPILLTYIFPRKISDNQFFASVSVGALAVTFHRLVHPIFWKTDEFYIGILFTAAVLGSWEVAKRFSKRPTALS